MTFYLSITESLNRVIAVEAESLEDAIEKAENACNDGIVDLTMDDWAGREIGPEPYDPSQRYQKI